MWYYWCGSEGYYYPLSYINMAAPTPGDVMPPDGEEVPEAGEGEQPGDSPGGE